MDALMEGLGMTSSSNRERAAEFLSEDPDIVAERDQLASKLARVDEVYEKLSRFTR